MRFPSSILALVLAAGAPWLALSTTAEQGPPSVQGLTLLERWETADAPAQARVISSIESSCLQRVERLLVEVPEAGRVLLEQRKMPQEGRRVWRFVDDASGWSATLLQVSGVRREIRSPADHGDVLATVDSHLEAEQPVTWRFEADGVGAFELSSTTRDSSLDHAFVRRATYQDRHQALAASVPREALPRLKFLESALGSENGSGTAIGSYAPLIHVLTGLLAQSEGVDWTNVPTEEWQIVVSKPEGHRGTLLKHGELLEMARGFESLDAPEDPLHGLHAPVGGGCDP